MLCLGGQGQREDEDDSPEGFTITPWDWDVASMDVNWVNFEEPEEYVYLDVRLGKAHGDDDDRRASGIRKAYI